jgi:hypothetical protein
MSGTRCQPYPTLSSAAQPITGSDQGTAYTSGCTIPLSAGRSSRAIRRTLRAELCLAARFLDISRSGASRGSGTDWAAGETYRCGSLGVGDRG